MAAQALGAGRVEQIGGILQHPREGVPGLPQIQHQVELGGYPLPCQGGNGKTLQTGLLQGRVLQGEHHLEQRVAA